MARLKPVLAPTVLVGALDFLPRIGKGNRRPKKLTFLAAGFCVPKEAQLRVFAPNFGDPDKLIKPPFLPMRAITDFVRASALPEALKEELAGDYMMKQHALYVQLPTWLAPLFGPQVRPAQVEQLSFSAYYYFRFLLVMDHVLDAAPTGAVAATPAATRRLLTYCDLYERSVRGLAALFGPEEPFWGQLDACKAQYAAAILQEKERSATRGPFSLEAFEALAADKSVLCNFIVYALSGLGGTSAPVESLLACLRHLHIAMQCMDDVEDFRTDWEQSQYTYAHAQVEAYLAGEGLDARALRADQVHPYLYTSGTADALLSLGQQHLARALGVARSFQLDGLEARLAHLLGRCDFYRTDIADKLTRARQRAVATPTPAV
jgi:hypothetical protein